MVSRMPRKKDIHNNLREESVAAHLGRVTRPFPNILKSIRKIIHKRKTFETDANLCRSRGPSKSAPRSDRAMLKETKKTKQKTQLTATCQTVQTSVSMLNVSEFNEKVQLESE